VPDVPADPEAPAVPGAPPVDAGGIVAPPVPVELPMAVHTQSAPAPFKHVAWQVNPSPQSDGI